MVKGQQEFGATFLRAARQECVTPRTWLLSHLIWLERIPENEKLPDWRANYFSAAR